MAAMVGEAFLGAAVGKLVDCLASEEFINFFRGRKLDESLLNKLEVTMLELNKVLNDAENKQTTDSAVKRWLDELKDAVYHAEDLVDEIATKALQSKVEVEYPRGKKRFRDSLISPWNWLLGRGMNSNCEESHDMNSKLEKMIGMLGHFVMKAKDVLGLREVARQIWSGTRLPTTSLVDESCFYGRENDKEEIMKVLLSHGEGSEGMDVIPIVGMGGVGKTTLAQVLYNDGRVTAHFGKKAWVCVSDVFDVLSITRTVVDTVTGRASNTKDLNLLQVKLKESLSGKKFLIVLDDVWNENYDHWEALMTPFRFGACGSKIVVTTRNESVASTIQTIPIHGLKELLEEDCWKLFLKHAFEKGVGNAHPNLEKIGKEIVKKCKGLPLATKTMGGLLRTKREVEDWDAILKSAIWDLPNDKSNILPALRLSYHYLPSHLKRCFAYCSIFTKDYEFNKEELVLTWVAEGFLEKPKNNKTIEEEGNECFNELLSRSFFQRSNTKDIFVMHDLVHDLAQYILGDFCYRLEDDNPKCISRKVRHFSYVRGKFDGFQKFREIKESKCLRTFLQTDRRRFGKRWLSKKVLDEILPGLTRLRLLSLPGYENEELPYSIGKLMHLRFLNLSYTRINHLPESVCTLYNLETLLLSNCPLLTSLPAELVKLISLRHLDLSETNLKDMPSHISKLKDLQQLTAFVVGKCIGSGINELKELHHLRGTISISGLQNVMSGTDASEAKMEEKRYLEKLALEWDSTMDAMPNEGDILEKLKPHTNLKCLELKNYGATRCPTWLGDQSFCNMVSVRLENCKLCLSLPPLGQICSLKELTITGMPEITKVGLEFYGECGYLHNPFESLETLCFENMPKWVDWCILDAGEFPQLQKLKVIKCPKLVGDLPKKVPSLVSLEIKKCPELAASLPRTTSICELLLEECQGLPLDGQDVSSVEKVELSRFTCSEEFASELVTLKNLKGLKILQCERRLSFPEGMMGLNNLKELSVWLCSVLVVPLSKEMSHRYMSLESLYLRDCESLKSLPLGLFPKLRSLHIGGCKNFETLLIPDGIEHQSLTLLEDLRIVRCSDMFSFPRGGFSAPNLSYLWLSGCKKLKALPEQMHTLLPSLKVLSLRRAPEIESFPEGGLPSNLTNLCISDCKKLVGCRRDWGLQTLPSLTYFTLEGESEDVLESFPEEGLLPSTLTILRIADLPKLKSLNKRGLQHLGSLKTMKIDNCPRLQSLPEEGLQFLGSLKSMDIRKCHQLQSLPEEGLPPNLFGLQIVECPLLKVRYRREEGRDWQKIAHIPLINIDGEAIFDQAYLGRVDPEDFWI